MSASRIRSLRLKGGCFRVSDTDAAGRKSLSGFERKARVHGCQHTIYDLNGRLDVAKRLKNDEKLIAAQTGHHIAGPNTFRQPFCDGDEELVSRSMTETVIDKFEVVQINEDNRDSPCCMIDSQLLQMIEYLRPVGQARQGIMEGLMEKFLRPLLDDMFQVFVLVA